ncbi:hypothetical protein EDD22DRAFT_861924 [Suillus occidentalis]|nr:hypothetical protein EDD22DRAFT_861924 [Suillus occidentalis]
MHPDLHQKQLLLNQVRLHGCGQVDVKHITTWFTRYRASARKKSMQDDDAILFMNFTSEQLDILRPLLRNNPFPKKEMIDIWSVCIKAEPEEVSKWVLYHQAKAAPLRGTSEQSTSVSPTAPLPHLPTPARSLSPARARDMSLPLIATKEEPSPSSPLLNKCPMLTAPVSHTSLSQHATVVADVLDELNPPFMRKPSSEGPRPLRSSRKPSTHAEFNAMFKPYEKMMTQFIHNVECGKLQHLGWEPNLRESNMSVSPLI